MGRYAVTLPDLANSISASRDRYGWFAGGFWRRPNLPTNVRIQENVSTLAWFYTQDRPWNSYYLSTDLLDRLNVAVRYYLSFQRDDGAFPGIDGLANPAVVGFALVYLAQTYLLMERVAWDEKLRNSLRGALRRATDWFLDPGNDAVWRTAILTSNQVSAGLVGAALMGNRLGHGRLQALSARLDEFVARAVSDAGYFYEDKTVDFGYTTTVTLGDLAQIHILTGHVGVREAARRFLDFCSYNYLWEPDGAGHVINGAVAARIPAQFLDSVRADESSNTDTIALWSPFLPQADAFVTTDSAKARLRQDWWEESEPLPALSEVNPARPRTVLAGLRYPTELAQRAAQAAFRYRAETSFVEERHDKIFDQHFYYVRQPTYYTAAFWGTRQGAQQRSGCGFLYHPDAGTFVCSQAGSNLAWGTVGDGFDEAQADLVGRSTATQGGTRLHLTTYGFRRTISYLVDRIDMAVDREGSLEETVPFVLQTADQIVWAGGVKDGQPVGAGDQISRCRGVTVRRDSSLLELTVPESLVRVQAESGMTLFDPASRRLRAVILKSDSGSLRYRLRIAS